MKTVLLQRLIDYLNIIRKNLFLKLNSSLINSGLVNFYLTFD